MKIGVEKHVISYGILGLQLFAIESVSKHYGNRGTLRQRYGLKSAATIFTKYSAIVPGSGLSNGILCNLEAQGTAKLQEVKAADQKKYSLHVQGDNFLFRL